MITDDMTQWTLHGAFARRAECNPDAIFVNMIGERSETYAQTHRSALGVASALRQLGVRSGDAVIIMAPNSLSTIHCWLAVAFAGGVEVAINTGYRGQSLIHALNSVKARVICIDAQFLDRLKDVESELPFLKIVVHIGGSEKTQPAFEKFDLIAFDELDIDSQTYGPCDATYRDVASVVYTSGTSGPAKGVMMPHAQVYALARQSVEGLRLTQQDIYYCFHPMFHTAGKFIGLFAGVLSGAKVVFDRGFSAELWLDRIRQYRATVTLAHGAMLEMVYALPARPEDSDNVLERLLASPFPRKIAVDFEQRFGVRGIEAWGMTEINNPCWCSFDEPLRPGSCGKVNPAWAEVRIIDPETDQEQPRGSIGELVVRPKRPWTMMQGYVGMPEKTIQAWRNLWFHTGDSAYIDEEGYFYFVDRLADRIRRRAENISSYDIESAALDFPGITECAAVGVASEFEHDDDIKLCVVVAEGIGFDETSLIRHLVRLLPHFMVPRYVERVAALPRTPTNKVRKAELRAAGVTCGTWDRRAMGVSLREIAASAGEKTGRQKA